MFMQANSSLPDVTWTVPSHVFPSNWNEASPPPAMNREEFGDAFRHGYPMTLRFLLSRGAHSDTAEEIAQAAWAKGWECRQQLQRPHMVGAWVNSIAKNMLKNRLRADQKLEALTESSKSGGLPPLAVDLKRILSSCDRRDALILRGYYIEGYTTEEIARQVGLTPVTVRVRLLRLRRSLRTQLLKSTHPLLVAKAA
jgi:RNA polymerase sigma-70 factor, ECF subfamily